MKLKKKWVPAHTDYFLTLVRPDGRRDQHYLPYVYRTREEAQAMADRKNERYNPDKHGQLVVEATEREGGYALEGFLSL